MSEPDKNGGNLPHAVFRLADAQRERAEAEHRKVDEQAKWRELFADFFAWLKSIVKPKE